MAEQEACANIVASAVSEQRKSDGDDTEMGGGDRRSVQGESLLLPLLKELIDKHQQQQQQQPLARTQSSQSCSDESAGGAPTNAGVEDSGIESGEDFRLLAGLNRAEPLGPGLLSEVLSALTRLQTSLQQLDSASSDVLDASRKTALLQLIARLQASLPPPAAVLPPPVPCAIVDKPSSQTRFSRRRERKNRHTVGVSSEELADARRLMEEMVLRDGLNPNAPPPPSEEEPSTPNEFGYAIQKQCSDGDVPPNKAQTTSYRPVNFLPQRPKAAVKNTTPKPYQSDSLPSTASVSVEQTPTENPLNFVYPERGSELPVTSDNPLIINDVDIDGGSGVEQTEDANADPIVSPLSPCELDEARKEETRRLAEEKERVKAIHAAVVHKAAVIRQASVPNDEAVNGIEEDEPRCPDTDIPVAAQNGITRNIPEMSNNYNVSEMHAEEESRDITSAQRLLHIAQDMPKPINRFNHKKLRMKRANTIDIPKPLNYYAVDDDSDSSLPDDEQKNLAAVRKSNYLALRGPIRVGNSGVSKNNVVPTFEPKTDSDKKFLEFIKKNDSINSNKPLWTANNFNPPKVEKPKTNWSSTFGNIKTIFENSSTENSRPSSTTSNSAKKFWQSADDSITMKKPSNYYGPKISKQGNKYLHNLFEQKQQQSKLPWTGPEDEHKTVVSGSLRIDPNLKTAESVSVANKAIRFVPQPVPVNNFSHNPLSAFKPPPKRIQPQETQARIFNVTPGTSQSWTYTSPNTGIVKQIVNNADSNSSSKAYPVQTPTHRPTVYSHAPKPLATNPPFETIQEQSKSSAANPAPWVSNAQTEKRVLSIAATKFENSNKTNGELPVPPPRRASAAREKVYVPPIIKETFTHNSYRVEPKRNSMHEVPYHSNNLSSPQMVQQYQNHVNSHLNMNDNYEPRDMPPYPKTSSSYQYGRDENDTFEPVVHAERLPVQEMPKGNYEPMPPYPGTETVPNYDDSSKENSIYSPEVYKNDENFENKYKQNSEYESNDRDFWQFADSQPPCYSGYVDNITYSVQTLQNEPNTEPEVFEDAQPFVDDQPFVDTAPSHPKPLKIFDYPSPEPEIPARSENPEKNTDSNLMEYKAVSRVMKAPVSQTAVTVTQNTPRKRDEDFGMAMDLKNSLQKISSPEKNATKRSPDESTSPKTEQPRPSAPKNVNKVTSPKSQRRSSSGDRKKIERQNSLKRKSQTPERKVKEYNTKYPHSFTKRDETVKSVKPSNVEGPKYKKLNERGLAYQEPKITGSALETNSTPNDVDSSTSGYSKSKEYSCVSKEFPQKPHQRAATNAYNNTEQYSSHVNQPNSNLNYSQRANEIKRPAIQQESTQPKVASQNSKVAAVPNTVQRSKSPQQQNIYDYKRDHYDHSNQSVYYAQQKVDDARVLQAHTNPPQLQTSTPRENKIQHNSHDYLPHNDVKSQPVYRSYTPEEALRPAVVQARTFSTAQTPVVKKETPRRDAYDSKDLNYSSQCVVTSKQYPASQPDFDDQQRYFSPVAVNQNSIQHPRKQLSTESIEFNDQGESVVTSKLQIPVGEKFLPQFTSRSGDVNKTQPSVSPVMSKSESWQQIVQQQSLAVAKPPSPRASPRSRSLLQKAKSSHNLVPRQFEAGIASNDIVQKKRTVEAYFSGTKSPQPLTKTASQSCLAVSSSPTSYNPVSSVPKSNGKSVINRTRTSNKLSTQRQGSALSRSRTMPQVVFSDASDVQLLDESNVDEAFEDLFQELLS